MKVFTIKLDEEFDRVLTELSRKTRKKKSQVIREALLEYQEKLRRKELIGRMVRAAKRIKEDPEAMKDIKELEGTVGDGL
ncbi:ribbon-helix-helix protein, CopG family [Desulfurobacterium thermolithotrophum]|uniref:ribbon-helix-helix protein, CopG family n=1 Tax=Desulfurobacterium thermolithotrophum TaxID=64160 RepID=UPI0013CFD8BE|nr:ribbon-helix-helix protein, CopG family [Desulfurobacterium thermolithotrophum]